MLKTSWIALALPLLLLTACDDGKNGSTRSTAEIQAEWGAHCDAFAACPDGRAADACKAEFTCMEAAMRADVLDKAVACEHARACDTNDDACYSVEALGLTPSAAAMTFRTDCQAKRTTCANEGTSFADDYCYTAAMFEDATISTLSTCLSGACADVRTCFETAFAAAAPGCN
jgi:hypothetical protein